MLPVRRTTINTNMRTAHCGEIGSAGCGCGAGTFSYFITPARMNDVLLTLAARAIFLGMPSRSTIVLNGGGRYKKNLLLHADAHITL